MATPITLFSPLDPITLATKLKDEMAKRKKQSGFMVHGGGTEKKMNLVYGRRKISFGVEPKLQATMREHDGGTLISGELHEAGSKKQFLAVWFGFVAIFFMASLALWEFDDAPLLFNIVFSGIPGLMLIIFGLMVFKTRNDKDVDRGTPQKILDFLAETVEAKSRNS
ncbi:MAG: hypothetical protein Pars2KO_14230 [Parasphingorhabdus sp.]